MAKKSFKVRLIKSVIGAKPDQRATVKGLGLRKMNSEVVVKDTPEMRGMIFKIQHLVQVEVKNV